MFFFKKKNQKTFIYLGDALLQRVCKPLGSTARHCAAKGTAYFSAVILAVCLFVQSATGALAQPEPERLHEAKQLYVDMGGDRLFAPYFARLEKNLVDSVGIWSGRTAKDVQGAVETIIMPDVRASNHLAEHYIAEMALNFSLEELRQMDAFESTPLGRKLRDRRPEMETNIYDQEHAWATTIWPELFAKHKADLAAAGITRKMASP